MAEWLVAKNSEMKDGDRRIVTAGKREIGVFHKDGAYYAYSNTCLHQGGPACEGVLINNVVDIINPDRTYEGQTFGDETHFVCPWHGYEYDIKTGECIGDRKQKLRKFEVVKRGDEIYVVAWSTIPKSGNRFWDKDQAQVSIGSSCVVIQEQTRP